MLKRILVSTRGSSEIKIAFLNNFRLNNLEIEFFSEKFIKGNVYKGCITKIESGLDSIFINYGREKDGLLPFKEINYKYLNLLNITGGLKNILDSSVIIGKDVIVQIEKEEKEEKGSLLSTYLTLSGCYIVLSLGNLKSSGVSKFIDGEERKFLKLKIGFIFSYYNISIIVRTFGFERKFRELQLEINILLSQIKIIDILSKIKDSPILIYEEHSLVIKIIRDHLRFDFYKIIIDDIKIFNLIIKYLNLICLNFFSKVYLYNNNISLFGFFRIESQIEISLKREVFLFSGGVLTIDRTEALISIDINSSRFNKCENSEETALQTNLEAVDEIVKQIKIRNLTGLIIIDFIDMNLQNNKRVVEKHIEKAFIFDKSKIQIGKISKFGLLEVSRQKTKISLFNMEKSYCSKCNGTGKIDNFETFSFFILNLIEEEIYKINIYQIHLELPVDFFNYIINFKRKEILNLENIKNIKFILIANSLIFFPDYKIYKFRNISNKLLNKKLKKKRKY